MKKIVICIFAALVALSPRLAYADSEFLAIIQDKLQSALAKGSEILESYTSIQLNLQEVTSSRDILKTLREKAKQELKAKLVAELNNVKVSDLTLKGVASKLKTGPIANIKLVKTIGAKYTGRILQGNDVGKMASRNKQIEIMHINNMASLYARAIVRRINLKDELEELEDENNQIIEQSRNVGTRNDSANTKTENGNDSDQDAQLTKIIDAYKKTMFAANKRWNFLVQQEASVAKIKAEINLKRVRISEDSDDAQEDESAENKSGDVSSNGTGVYDIGSNIVNEFKENGWKGGLGAVVNQATQQLGGGNLMNTGSELSGITERVKNDISSGDYGSALEGIAGGVKKLDINQHVSDIVSSKSMSTGTYIGTGSTKSK